MNVSGKNAITISPVCNELYNRPLSSLIGFLENGLADFIFDYAKKHPEVIKKYDKTYPVLKFDM